MNAGYDTERWQSLDDDKRQRVLARAHAFNHATQVSTLATATNKGARWQSWEDDFIQEHSDLTRAEIARELGRTLYAVTDRRRKLHARKPGRQ